MAFIAYIYIIIITIVWLRLLIVDKSKAMCFLVYSEVIYMNRISPINIDFIIKILLLITALLSVLKYGFRKRTNVIFPTILFLIVGLLGAKFVDNYGIIDFIAAFLSIATGFLVLSINWPKKNSIVLLRYISFLPLFSIVMGILLLPLGIVPFFTRDGGTGVGGASLATNLSFFGVIGILSSITVYRITKNGSYRLLAYINLFIIATTLTRGGLMAGIIILLPDIFLWLIQSLKSIKKIMITATIIILSIVPLFKIGTLFIERSYDHGEISTSGRTEAWEFIIKKTKNKIYGNGLGNLKTLTDDELEHFKAPHNEYVRFYYETGILGLAICWYILLKCFKSILVANKNHPIYVISYILPFITYSFTDNTMSNFRFWIPYTLTMALIYFNQSGVNKKEIKQ